MSKISKLPLYLRTVSHLKPSQVLLRIKRRMGGLTKLKGAPDVRKDCSAADISRIPAMVQLDFCTDFLRRFDVNQIMRDEVCLLHHTETVDWETSWHEKLSTPLWRFNLQYFEYLLPLAKAYCDTADVCYIEKGKKIICSWIDACPKDKGGSAWDSYPISLRVINWLAFYAELEAELSGDIEFVQKINNSLNEQYVHLSKHLETDLLANHYLENLKALVILACYFDDRKYFCVAYEELRKQVAEQVLPDGMHFELSPMYHKIVLEDLLRIAACVKIYSPATDVVTDLHLQNMVDCLYSMERNAARTPLFNDAGDNVAKGKKALLEYAFKAFSLKPTYRSRLDNAGYVILERQTDGVVIKLIFDVGQAGPVYAMGHAHCDALSFECFVNGRPWIVNLGTYAYQDERRLDYKAACSHSAVVLEGEEQHECWASFRIARCGRSRLIYADAFSAEAEFTYPSGITVRRQVRLTKNGLEVKDSAVKARAVSVFHISDEWAINDISGARPSFPSYAPEFGRIASASTLEIPLDGGACEISFPFPTVRGSAKTG